MSVAWLRFGAGAIKDRVEREMARRTKNRTGAEGIDATLFLVLNGATGGRSLGRRLLGRPIGQAGLDLRVAQVRQIQVAVVVLALNRNSFVTLVTIQR